MDELINAFMEDKELAIIGVSRTGKGFSNLAWKELGAAGYNVYPVNRHGGSIDGVTLYSDLAGLPPQIRQALILVSPENCPEALRDCAAAGIGRVWLQKGVASGEAIQTAEELGLDYVHDKCIIMYLAPGRFPHSFHRWLAELFGRI